VTVSTPPKARPAAALGAALIAVVLIAVAVVAIRELAVSQRWASGSPWSLDAVRALDGLTPSVGVAAAGVVIALLGLVLVWLALKPAARTHLQAHADGDLWLSAPAVAALARGVADRAPGVISADATRVSRRRITVEVVTSGDPAAVAERVDSALQSQVQGLTRAAVTVRTREVSR
jgi:hypothetical protein